MFLNTRHQRGLTLIELLIALSILAVLASAVIPLAQTSVRRTKEIELKRNLREIRSAIDAYKADYDRAIKEKKIIAGEKSEDTETGYPLELEKLIDGDRNESGWGGLYPHKRRYLRRIPKDPFDTDDLGWGMRSVVDAPDSTSWGGEDIFDVYSQSTEIGLDGTAYNTW